MITTTVQASLDVCLLLTGCADIDYTILVFGIFKGIFGS